MPSHQNDAEVIVALDVGGTFIKSARFAGDDVTVFPPMPSHSGESAEAIVGALREAIRHAGVCDRVGIAIPGPFDYACGISRMTHKFEAIRGLDLRRELRLGIPVVFVHDCNAFLLGELAAGALTGCARAGAITLGTGIGAAFAENGIPRVNDLGSPAAEVSLWNKPWRDGIVEDAVSARALLAHHPATGDVKTLARLALAGDPQAVAVWREFGETLAAILGAWYRELGIERVALGGQVAKDFELFGPALQALPIVPAKQPLAALYGACAAARASKLI